MKKYVLILVASIILELAIGCFVFKNIDTFSVAPTENKLLFDGLSSAVCDLQDNLYTIDNSRRRIAKINSRGEVQYVIENKNYEENLQNIAVDEYGNLYAMSTILDSKAHFVNGEEIVKYTADGKESKVIYKIEYKNGEKPLRTGYLKGLEVKGKKIYFYNIKESKIELNSISLSDYSCKLEYNTNFSSDPYIYNIAGIEKGKIFYSTKKGEIYKIDLSGNPKLIYSGKNSREIKNFIPVFINYDYDDFIYFLDVNGKKIERVEPDSILPPQKYFEISELVDDNYGIKYSNVQDLRLMENSQILIVVDNHIVKLTNDKKVYSVIDGAEYSYNLYYFHWLIWLLAGVQALLLLVIVYLAYFKIMERKTTLLLKQVVIFVPIIIVSLITVSVIISRDFTNKHEEEIKNNIKVLAHIGANTVDAANMQMIKNPKDFMGNNYKVLKQQIHSLFEGKPNIGDYNAYAAVYKYEDGHIYTCAYYDDSMIPYYPYNDSDADDYLKVVKSGEILVGKMEDTAGQWIYAIGPIYDNNGKVIGVFETGSDMKELNQYKKNVYIKVAKVILLIIAIIIVIFIIMTYYLLSSIRELKSAVDEIASGKLDTVVSVTSRDEGAELCKGFNIMSQYLNEYILQITELSESYYRFVPQQYLSMLGKESILDVNLGDQAKYEMSVLTLNIRDFFILSETMTPEENFQFINLFLKEISPLITDNNGFVDDYTGAGIVALFPDSGEDAAKTSIEIIEKLKSFNESTRIKGKPLDLGIGIHKGSLMLGIIGSERRLEGTVISDSVNLAASLEKLSLELDVSTLITESIVKDLKAKDIYEYRYLGKVQIEGKEGLVDIYDLYHSDSKERREGKNRTKEIFEEGIRLYHQGSFYEARNSFLEAVKRDSNDKVSKIYFFLSDEYYKNGTKESWMGELSI